MRRACFSCVVERRRPPRADRSSPQRERFGASGASAKTFSSGAFALEALHPALSAPARWMQILGSDCCRAESRLRRLSMERSRAAAPGERKSSVIARPATKLPFRGGSRVRFNTAGASPDTVPSPQEKIAALSES
jgi:hypothetical protein